MTRAIDIAAALLTLTILGLSIFYFVWAVANGTHYFADRDYTTLKQISTVNN